MGSPCEILVERASRGEAWHLAMLAATEAWRVEAKFSRYRSGNIVAAINSAGGRPVEVDEETARLLGFAATLHSMSQGRFDITSGVLRRLWTFDGTSGIPSPAQVHEVQSHVGWHKVAWKPPFLEMPAGMQIDFGGVGKEYAVDRAVELLREATDRACLVNFGGDLAVTRAPRHRDAWHVGIESVQDGAHPPSKLVLLRAGALATSGVTRRYVMHEGRRYGHILDPRTGWPILGAPAAVTVAADTCVHAGALCTLAMLEGEGAEDFLRHSASQHWITRDRDSTDAPPLPHGRD